MIKQLIRESYGVNFTKENKKKIWEFRQLLASSLIEADGTDDNGYVTLKTRYDADAICRDIVYNHLPKCIRLRDQNNNFDPNIDFRDSKPSFKTEDCALLMFDRDYWVDKPVEMSDEDYEKQSHENYRTILARCQELNYVPVLTTPLFEFWLLLHHGDGIVDLKKIKMDLHSSRNKIGNLLKKLEGYEDNGKSLTEERKRFYSRTFTVALDISKGLETDPMELIYKTGTNVGIVLMELMDGEKPS